MKGLRYNIMLSYFYKSIVRNEQSVNILCNVMHLDIIPGIMMILCNRVFNKCFRMWKSMFAKEKYFIIRYQKKKKLF